jgi:hypothetical protein
MPYQRLSQRPPWKESASYSLIYRHFADKQQSEDQVTTTKLDHALKTMGKCLFDMPQVVSLEINPLLQLKFHWALHNEQGEIKSPL